MTSATNRRAWIADAKRHLRGDVRRLRGVVNRRIRLALWRDMRRLQPVDARFGMGRGTPDDRVYIETFLRKHQALIRGHVLEVGDARYSTMFGGPDVTKRSVLDVSSKKDRVTIAGDLAQGIPGYDDAFDCLLLTQVLPFVFDVDVVTGNVLTATALLHDVAAKERSPTRSHITIPTTRSSSASRRGHL